MTTRELLREVAHDLDRLVSIGQAVRGWAIAEQQAAALRAIADRFDAEIERLASGETESHRLGQERLADMYSSSLAALARLDAPVTPEVKP